MALTEGALGALVRAARAASDPMEALLARELTGEPFGVQQAVLRYEPPRGTPKRIADLVQNKTVQRRMDDTIERGMEMGGHLWYDTSPIAAAFVNELGDDGLSAFSRFMDYQAAVSPRSRVGEQVRRGSYYYGQEMRGEPFSKSQPPEPYGHIAHKSHSGMLNDVRNNGEFDPIRTPKAASYAQNLKGNQAPATIDSHALALPAIFSEDPRFLKSGKYSLAREGASDDGGYVYERMIPQHEYKAGVLSLDEALENPSYWGGSPAPTEYAAMERFYSDLAKRHDLTPAQAQSAAWIGGGDITGVQSGSEPFLKLFLDRVRHTAKQRGESEVDVLRKMIRGQEPLLGIGGAGALGAMALQDDEGM